MWARPSVLVLNHDGGVASTISEHELIQDLGIIWMESYAAVGGHGSQIIYFSGAMGGDIAVEEYGPGHGSVVVLARIVFGVHKLNTKRTGRSPTILFPSRDRPLIEGLTINPDNHGLVRFIDDGVHFSRNGGGDGKGQQGSSEYEYSPHRYLL